MANRLGGLPQYPAPPGNKPICILDVIGPASYTQIAIATPPTGGQDITARQFGLSTIEAAWVGGVSDNGQYTVQVVMAPFNNLNASPAIKLVWSLVATGAQVA